MTDDQKAARFDLYGALYVLCSRWHSGQWSRGYRILSRLTLARYKPGLGLTGARISFDSDAQRATYRRLAKRYRHKLCPAQPIGGACRSCGAVVTSAGRCIACGIANAGLPSAPRLWCSLCAVEPCAANVRPYTETDARPVHGGTGCGGFLNELHTTS